MARRTYVGRAVALALASPALLGCSLLGGNEASVQPHGRPTVTPVTEAAALPTLPTVTTDPATEVTAVPTPTFIPTAVTQPTQTPAPPEARPAEAPAQAVVIYGGGEGLHLRAAPNQHQIASLLKGTALTVRGPAQDEGGFRWWPVAIADGWMAEGPRDSAQPRWLAPVDAERLEVGRAASVKYAGADGLNVRASPGPTSPKIATLLRGSTVTVVEGPHMVNGVAWWRVQVAPGWVAEGPADPARPRWLQLTSH